MPVDVSEALRYLGAENSTDLRKDVLSVASVLEEALVPRYVYRVFPVTQKESSIDLLNGQLQLPGHLAQKILKNCEFAAIMVCTLGVSFDSMLRSWQARDMSRAVILDACGSAYVESGCDMAQSEIAARYASSFLTDRFSPGYGDLPLTLQPDFLRILDAGRQLGIECTSSCLLNPSKTVTAVIGISSVPQPARIRGCECCMLQNQCHYRKRGATCVHD